MGVGLVASGFRRGVDARRVPPDDGPTQRGRDVRGEGRCVRRRRSRGGKHRDRGNGRLGTPDLDLGCVTFN